MKSHESGRFSYVALAAAGVLSITVASAPVEAAEWEQNTPYYERDGWLDISEWFDGNSYNPTDESTWRWDDESYDFSDDVGADADNDAWYGYMSRNDDDWFYDYYDPSAFYTFDSDAVYAYGARYLDYDDDGAYDASVSYTDWNGDGIYDDYDYFTFNDTADKQVDRKKRPDRLKQQLPNESRRQSVTGTIENVKQVRVRGDEHTLVQIRSGSGEKLAVDLGAKSRIAGVNLSKGTSITVQGPRSRVGDKAVVLATSVESGGSTRQIDRKREEITGKVISTRKQQVHGLENTFAIVEVTSPAAAGMQPKAAQQQPGTQPGTQADDAQQKPAGQASGRTASQAGTNLVAVDLGPSKRLGMDIKQGMSLTFTAVPVKVADRRLMLAQTVSRGGRMVPIDRRTSVNQQANARTPAPASGTTTGAPRTEPANAGQPRAGTGQTAGEHSAHGIEMQRKPPADAR